MLSYITFYLGWFMKLNKRQYYISIYFAINSVLVQLWWLFLPIVTHPNNGLLFLFLFLIYSTLQFVNNSVLAYKFPIDHSFFHYSKNDKGALVSQWRTDFVRRAAFFCFFCFFLPWHRQAIKIVPSHNGHVVIDNCCWSRQKTSNFVGSVLVDYIDVRTMP